MAMTLTYKCYAVGITQITATSRSCFISLDRRTTLNNTNAGAG